MKPFIAYYRVSTDKQGRSGLGLEAQRALLTNYITSVQGTIAGDFVEVESGKSHKNRPELAKALAAAKAVKGILIVAKLDRLARNVAFVSALLETKGVEFRAADMPEANRMVIQLMAVMAEYEAKLISDRTKAAIEARRARGVEWGVKARNSARQRLYELKPLVEEIRAAGLVKVPHIRVELAKRGREYTNNQVRRILERLQRIEAHAQD